MLHDGTAQRQQTGRESHGISRLSAHITCGSPRALRVVCGRAWQPLKRVLHELSASQFVSVSIANCSVNPGMVPVALASAAAALAHSMQFEPRT